MSLQRVCSLILGEHLQTLRQMAFVPGPRLVGKTTTCRALSDAYLDWDNEDHREITTRGPGAVASYAGLEMAGERPEATAAVA